MIEFNGVANHDLNRSGGAYRVLVTEFYDGAVEGLIQFTESGPVYLFRMVGDVNTRPRSWDLQPMPWNAIEEFVRIVAPHLTPKWPVWVPVWKFPTPEIEEAMMAQTQSILDAADDAVWQIKSDDLYGFSHCTARRLHHQVA